MTQLIATVVLVFLIAGLVLSIRRKRRTTAAVRQPPARDDVRITVYRPASVVAERWYELLVYAHRAEGPTAEGGWQADLSKRVAQEAAAELGDLMPRYRTATEDAAIPVVRDTQLQFVPQIDGFQFNPPRLVLNWVEELHEAEFRMCAGAHLDGTTARGRLSVFNGPLLIAEMALVIRVSTDAGTQATAEPVRSTVAPYRRVFASYSHHDADVVRRLREYGQALGDRYLLDVTDIRAGERWEPRIEELIAQADVFQLFWSWNSIGSEYVQREWRHALNLGRENFVRPVYWEDPLPAAPERNLPPSELSALHFQRVRLAEAASPPAAAPMRSRPVLTAPRLATAAMLLIAAGAVGVAVQNNESAIPPDDPSSVTQDTLGEAPPISTPTDQPPTNPSGGGRGGASRPPRPNPTVPVVQPAPPVTTPLPPAPAPATTRDVVVGSFDVPSADSDLTRFATELRRAFLASWSYSEKIDAPDGSDPVDVARATQTPFIITATLSHSPEGVLVETILVDLRRGGTRTVPRILVAPEEPVSQTARRIALALEQLIY
jgi:hypothetical protein